jgi:hypothetical protein
MGVIKALRLGSYGPITFLSASALPYWSGQLDDARLAAFRILVFFLLR